MSFSSFVYFIYYVTIVYSTKIQQNQLFNVTENQKYLNENSTSINVKSKTNHESFIEFHNSTLNMAKLSLLHNRESDFIITTGDEIHFKANKENEILIQSQLFKVHNFIFLNDLKFYNIKQWKLTHAELFNVQPIGWTDTSITQCGGIHMLGGYGYFAKGEVRKEFTNLPQHSMIKIQSSYHFIDKWTGESGYMKVNTGKDGSYQYAWAEKYDINRISKGINVCGSSTFEGKLTSNIEVELPHVGDSISISFGSNLGNDDALEHSFGISNVQIYIK